MKKHAYVRGKCSKRELGMGPTFQWLSLQGHFNAAWAAGLVNPGPPGVAMYMNHGELECQKEWLILDY